MVEAMHYSTSATFCVLETPEIRADVSLFLYSVIEWGFNMSVTFHVAILDYSPLSYHTFLWLINPLVGSIEATSDRNGSILPSMKNQDVSITHLSRRLQVAE